MLSTMGALLAGYGMFGSRTIDARSLGINVNLIWGSALIAFGAVLLAVSARSRRDRS